MFLFVSVNLALGFIYAIFEFKEIAPAGLLLVVITLGYLFDYFLKSSFYAPEDIQRAPFVFRMAAVFVTIMNSLPLMSPLFT